MNESGAQRSKPKDFLECECKKCTFYRYKLKNNNKTGKTILQSQLVVHLWCFPTTFTVLTLYSDP